MKPNRLLSLCRRILPLVLCSLLLPAPASAGDYVDLRNPDGVRLYYEEAGSGAPVVFVPGWIMTTRYFHRQTDYFRDSKTTRFIVYDPRAQGRSSKTLAGANYIQHAHDLKQFIDALGLKDVVLGGWSWGMDTVYAYISIYGTDNIRGIVNIDQTPYPLAPGEGNWADGDVTAMKQFFDAFAADRLATTRAFLPSMFTAPISPDELSWMTAETMLTPDPVAQLLFYDGWMFDHRETVRRTGVPRLYVVSEARADAAEAFLARDDPGGRLVALGAHAMFYDHAPAFNAALSRFLAELR